MAYGAYAEIGASDGARKKSVDGAERHPESTIWIIVSHDMVKEELVTKTQRRRDK
jgi:hypothetical protein